MISESSPRRQYTKKSKERGQRKVGGGELHSRNHWGRRFDSLDKKPSYGSQIVDSLALPPQSPISLTSWASLRQA
jgi:hypothetical protein